MREYWSNSKLADWIRGTDKPGALELGAWDTWEQQAQQARPVRYWLAETVLDTAEDAVRWPAEQINSLRYWLNNRFVARTHALTSSSLKPGAWHEFDTRILHCVFDELVNFVQVEKAWMQVCWGDEATRKKYALPFWRKHWWTRWFREWRCPQAGLDQLAWEMSLVWTEDQVGADSELLGQRTDQAERAKEIYELYFWWTVVRPARPDPYEASGWTAYCEASREATGGKLRFDGRNDSAELKKLSKSAHKKLDQMEADYEKEDTKMLINLIQIRRSLWT
jgi:hypothetical protein